MSEVGASAVGLAERLIEAIDWSSYRRLAGDSAAGVGEVLMSLLTSDRRRVETVRDFLENEIAPQSNLYSAAEPAVSVLAASLVDLFGAAGRRWFRTGSK